ncbi:acyl-CoA dehydrogenase family protein [Spirillospora sp. CA-255316]
MFLTDVRGQRGNRSARPTGGPGGQVLLQRDGETCVRPNLAIQLHGGDGYSEKYEVERLHRDAPNQDRLRVPRAPVRPAQPARARGGPDRLDRVPTVAARSGGFHVPAT